MRPSSAWAHTDRPCSAFAGRSPPGLRWWQRHSSPLPPVQIRGLEALGGAVGTRVTNYYVALMMLAGICSLWAWMRRAPLGLAFEAIRQGEERAAALGVDTHRTKRIALAVSGLFAGGAGA